MSIIDVSFFQYIIQSQIAAWAETHQIRSAISCWLLAWTAASIILEGIQQLVFIDGMTC